jgi:hypothetical protein
MDARRRLKAGRQLSRGNPAYAEHREDACHLHSLNEEKKTGRVWKAGNGSQQRF